MTALRKILECSGDMITLHVPEELQGKTIEVIINTVDKPEAKLTEKRYDFSDVAGKMNWKGDAVTEQRKLRDQKI